MTAEPQPQQARNILLAAVEIIAIAIIFTSFMTWIRFDSTELLADGPHFASVKVSGDDLTGATDPGDGLVTAIGGALAALFAVASRFAAGYRALLSAGIAIAGLTSFGVAGYDVVKDWVPGGTGAIIAVEVDVARYPAMYSTAILGLALGLTGLALFIMAQRADRRRQAEAEAEAEAETEEDSEETETWA